MRLTKAVTDYCNQHGWESALEGLEWKFEVFKDETVNAFCLPNGKNCILWRYTKICKYSWRQQLLWDMKLPMPWQSMEMKEWARKCLYGSCWSGRFHLSRYWKPENTSNIWTYAVLGSQFGVLLPYSRKHEYEADRLGLIIMAMAGYDINVAPKFWQTMSSIGGSKQPEFISTRTPQMKTA